MNGFVFFKRLLRLCGSIVLGFSLLVGLIFVLGHSPGAAAQRAMQTVAAMALPALSVPAEPAAVVAQPEAEPDTPLVVAAAAPQVESIPSLLLREPVSQHEPALWPYSATSGSNAAVFAAGDPAVAASGGPQLLAPPLPGGVNLAVSLDSDRVWGVVGAGETVTVTVDGVQMGAGRADGVGFFWTTLYDADGNRPALSGGEVLAIYADGAPVANTTLRAMAGAVDVLAGAVDGVIDSVTSALSVTAYIDGVEPTMTSYSQTVSTDNGGVFTVDLSGAGHLICDESVTLAYREDGIEVHTTLYSNRLCVLPFPHFLATGVVEPGVVITVTSYEPDGTSIRSQETLTTDPATGRYNAGIDTTDDGVVVVEVEGGAVLSRTVDTLDLAIDTTNDRIFGAAEPNATLRCLVGDLTALGYKNVRATTVADAGGFYTFTLAGLADLTPGRWYGVYVADAEGDDLVRWSPAQGSVEVNQTWNEVSGVAVAPPGPLAIGRGVTLTLNGDTFVKSMDWYGNYTFGPDDGLPDIVPGDVLTVEAEGFGWQGVVQVMTMTVVADMDNDRFTGSVEGPTDRVELWAHKWNGWADQSLAPVGETAEMLVTASGSFAAAPAGFDLRNAAEYQIGHRTANEYLEQFSGQLDFVRVWPQYNGAIALFGPPGTAYTLTLRDSSGVFKGQLTGVSSAPIGHAGFNDFNAVGAQIEYGDLLEARSSGGFSQTVEVVALSVAMDPDNNVVQGTAPPNALVSLAVDGQGQGFVPTGPDGVFRVAVDQLQYVYGDGDLVWGNWGQLCYQDENGNHVCYNYDWPSLTVRTFMDGCNDVFGDYAIPGNPIYITVTHPVSGVIATGVADPGSGWMGPFSYWLEFDAGVLAPGVTVTANWGDSFVDSVDTFTLTGIPDPDTEQVIGNAPPDSTVSLVVREWQGGEGYLDNVPVDAGGVYTANFNDIGWDIQYGDGFSVYAPAGHNHQMEYNFWVPMPELQIEKQQTNGMARPGGTYIYRIRYWNNGNGDAENTVITDTLPADTTYFADTSGFPVTNGGGSVTWDLGTTASNSDGEFYVALLVASGAPTQTHLGDNCVDIYTTSPGDPDMGNNSNCTGGPWVDDSTLGVGVDKWPYPSDPHPGEEFSYDIDYWNDTSAASGPVWLTDTLPVSTTFVRWEEQWGWGGLWTEVVTTGGQFVLHAPAGIPGDMGGHIRLTLRLDGAAPLGMRLTNHIVIAMPHEDHPDNNEDTNTDAQVSGARYDFQVDKWLNGGDQTPNGSLNYGIRYENRGNIAAHAWLTDTLPENTTYQEGSAGRCDWNGCIPFDPVAVTEDYVVWDLGMVGVNENLDFSYNVDIDLNAPTGPLTNCVTLGGAFAESTPGDNTACVADMIYPNGPNLRVTKEHWWNGDGQLGYRIQFYNLGDETVSDVWITDTLPLSTTWDGWWNLNFDWNRLVEQSLNSDVLIWHFSELYPGDSGQLEFNANLDNPGERMRWYTNMVEITLPGGDPSPGDNTYTDVAFSGGEVDRVEVSTRPGGDGNLWGNAIPGWVTVTTPYTQVVVWADGGCDGCWNVDHAVPLDAGDLIEVEAGGGLMPVSFNLADPFTAEVDTAADEVYGQLGGWNAQALEIHGNWAGGYREITTESDGSFATTYPDIPRGAEGYVRYETEANYAQVVIHREFRALDLILTVNLSHDWIEGNYESGHTAWLTVTDSLGAIKATAHGTTGPVVWWNGQTGFSTNDNVPWDGQQPDIVPGDWVYGALDNGYTTTVRVGEITGNLDIDHDRMTGTVNAPWFTGLLNAQCWIDGVNDSNQEFSVNANNGAFTCDFSTVWDLTPNESVNVQYQEPDGDWVRVVFQEPTPHLRVEKWLDGGNPGEGGNVTFYVQYANFGDADAESVVITDTLQGMTYLSDTLGLGHAGGGGQVVWNLGTVAPGDWIHFYVFARVDVAAGERVTNTAHIATSNPYDQGDAGEKISVWSGDVQPNDTRLTVDKGAWTGDPAAGYTVVFHVNACNNGGTGSTQVTITDTLHPSMTLQSWYADTPGWTSVGAFDPHQLVVTRPTLSGWRCEGIYLTALVDAAAAEGLSLSNHAVISAANDLSPDDNETWWWGNVGAPHTNLSVDKWWNWGRLTPGGELDYQIHYQNNGNIPITSTFRITDTLPVSTTFGGAWYYDSYGRHPLTPTVVGNGYVVWVFHGLSNGYSGDIEVLLNVDPDAVPGTELVNQAEATCLPGEDTCDDNVSAWTETLFDHGPNLRVFKWGDWHGDRPGHAWYQFRVENVGDVPIAQAVVTDTYPALMDLEGGLNTDWSRVADYTDNPAEHWFQVTLDDLQPGYRLDVNFNMTMAEPIAPGLTLTNTVSVAPVAGDTNPADDSSDYVLTTGPDLWVDKTLVDGVLRPGELVTFSLRFGNDQVGHTWWWGLQGNALLTDTLPAAMEFITATQHWCGWTEWCSQLPLDPDAQTLVWELWPLHTGEWNELYVTVRITDTATGLDTLTNSVEIASTEPVSDTEPTYANNVASLDLPIDLPYFEVSKVYASSRVVSTMVTYTLTVTNTGNSDGHGVLLFDRYPVPLGREATDGEWVGDDAVQWPFPSLAAGDSAIGWFSGVIGTCTPGTYTNGDYAVIASDEGVTSTVGAPVSFTTIAPTLAISFDQNMTEVVVGTTVAFTDTSTTNGPGLVTWAWDFGDGGTSAAQHPSHQYNSDGTFTVRLTVTDACDFTGVATATVMVNPPDLVADFDQSAASIIRTQTVVFTDTSTTDGPAIVAWAWGFGDGGVSVAQHPSHQYTSVGEFTVTLVVTDALGYSDAVTSTVNVTLDCQPLTGVTFTYLPAHPLVNTPVSFSAVITPTAATTPITYTWAFGDGQTLTANTPSAQHTYATEGAKTVQLTVVNPCTPPATVQRERSVVIESYRLYLPLVMRNY